MSWLNLESSSVLVAIAVLLGLLGLLAAMALFARNYIKVPPSTVAIFFGRKHTLWMRKATRRSSGSVSSAAAPRCASPSSSRWRISR